MALQKSILSRIVALHLVAVIVAAVLLRFVLHWSLASDIATLQLNTMAAQIEIFARHLEPASRGGWSLHLPDGVRDQYSDAYDRYSYAIIDDAGKVIFSSHASKQPLFAIDPDATGIVPYRARTPRGARTIAGASARKDIDGHPVWIQVAEKLSHRDVIVDDVLANFLRQVVWIIVPVLLLLLVADTIIFRLAMRPLHRASDRAKHISPTRLDVRLPTDDMPPEILPLVKAVNQALDRLELGFRSQREFAADAAHELRTPLAILRTRIETLPHSEASRALGRDVENMSRVVSQLLDATELETAVVDPESVADLHEVGVEIAEFIAPLALKRGKSIELIGVDEPVLIVGNAEMIRRATRNLVENALHHTPEGTTIEIVVGQDGSISVIDNGDGVPPENRESIFKRFWRQSTRASGGAGLGLSIVKKIVEAHHGSITVEDAPGRGARFIMRFPLLLA
ncbi:MULTISPECIES: ATP-binding protein [unclassified Nitrobacter]|uniref:ATP-binding protein n=1 Tax=unclassified Nitrobacter TaxID=2620411 RepID=UPI000929E801|nr:MULTISPECIES: ATP-binding protein [unclassified Nitrobacter]MBN9147965.1 HAMP domain-containing protein [Nitrobacter sp.]MBN9489873.1 HAMP domain-containing protein [Alphaproteobacteria bacterium]OJV01453.1 MAG: two-component sensor histidine kinase [Nitrobacter sp. 62-23]